MKRFAVWLRVIVCFLFSFLPVKAHILTAQETVDELISTRKSLVRLGDGEFNIFNHKDIHYQKWSPKLKKEFIKISGDYRYNSDKCGFLLAVPCTVFKRNGFFLMKKRVFIASWVAPKLYFKRHFRQDIPYGDSFLFAKGNEPVYQRLWENNRTIIFIHHNEVFANQFAKKYGKEVFFIHVPPQNAFEEIDKVYIDVRRITSYHKLDSDNCQILISAGPCGKILAVMLTEDGFWCIDTGHCWDNPLEVIT